MILRLQRGRALTSAEITFSLRSVRQSSWGFNGAALSRARRYLPWYVEALRRYGLQRGRALTSAEMRAIYATFFVVQGFNGAALSRARR